MVKKRYRKWNKFLKRISPWCHKSSENHFHKSAAFKESIVIKIWVCFCCLWLHFLPAVLINSGIPDGAKRFLVISLSVARWIIFHCSCLITNSAIHVRDEIKLFVTHCHPHTSSFIMEWKRSGSRAQAECFNLQAWPEWKQPENCVHSE